MKRALSAEQLAALARQVQAAAQGLLPARPDARELEFYLVGEGQPRNLIRLAIDDDRREAARAAYRKALRVHDDDVAVATLPAPLAAQLAHAQGGLARCQANAARPPSHVPACMWEASVARWQSTIAQLEAAIAQQVAA